MMKIAENDGSYSAQLTSELLENKKENLPIKAQKKVKEKNQRKKMYSLHVCVNKIQ